jgi:serine protease AprX
MKNILLILFIFICSASHAQNRYLIKFKDKATNPFSISNPAAYLSPRALQRRARYNILIDSLDLPVTPRYIDSVRLAGFVTILNSSKWLNQVTIRTTDPLALAKINSFPFVISFTAIASRSNTTTATTLVNKKLDEAGEPIPTSANSAAGVDDVQSNFFNYGLASGQVNLHQGAFLHNHGFRGENMQISVLDAGFYHYLTLPTFDSIRANNQILNTYDFVANETSVDEDNTHGMQCLSGIAANMPGVFVGTAPKATFCLYRTEDVASETRIEEHNLAAGYERADSIGVDVCSISLGYNTFDISSQNYTYANMDGNTTMSAIASRIAAKKGMLLAIAAGNDGNGSWHYVATPADADSVMTVGATDTLGNVASFSSYGPSSNGRIKPNIAATGLRAVVANPGNGQPSYGNGTSFATPNIAGLTTCLWQAFPEFNNMTVLDAMQKSANRFTNPNDRIGYGVPDMKKAFCILLKKSYSQNATVASCIASFSLNVKHDNTMNIIVEKKENGAANYSTIKTIIGTGNFTNKNISFTDNISTTAVGAAIYRVRIDIATDTSFYLDSINVNVTKPNFGADKTVAKCDNSVINLNLLYNTTNLVFGWTNNGNIVANPTQVAGTGTYQLVGANTIGCTDTALIVITANPNLNLGADKNISKCTDSSINLTTLFNTTNLSAAWKLNTINFTAITAASIEGDYQLIASNFYGCVDTALVKIKNDVSLCPVPAITINPNPVVDNLSVYVFKNIAAKVEIMIQNVLGQKVINVTNEQSIAPKMYSIPMSKLAAGTYFVTVFVNGKNEVTKKIVKE